MMQYYKVYKKGGSMCVVVRAMSEEDAINQAYMKYGSASKYTGLGRTDFVAYKV